MNIKRLSYFSHLILSFGLAAADERNRDTLSIDSIIPVHLRNQMASAELNQMTRDTMVSDDMISLNDGYDDVAAWVSYEEYADEYCIEKISANFLHLDVCSVDQAGSLKYQNADALSSDEYTVLTYSDSACETLSSSVTVTHL
jgi:hypothetical protein